MTMNNIILPETNMMDYCNRYDTRSMVRIIPCVVKGLDVEVMRAVIEKRKMVDEASDVKAFMECEDVQDNLFVAFMQEEFDLTGKNTNLWYHYDEIIAPLKAVERLMGRAWMHKRTVLVERLCMAYFVRMHTELEMTRSMKLCDEDVALRILRWTKEESDYLDRFMQLKMVMVDYLVRW